MVQRVRHRYGMAALFPGDVERTILGHPVT